MQPFFFCGDPFSSISLEGYDLLCGSLSVAQSLNCIRSVSSSCSTNRTDAAAFGSALTPRCLIKHRLVRNDQHQLLSSALGDLGKAVLAEQNASAPAPSPPVCYADLRNLITQGQAVADTDDGLLDDLEQLMAMKAAVWCDRSSYLTATFVATCSFR